MAASRVSRQRPGKQNVLDGSCSPRMLFLAHACELLLSPTQLLPCLRRHHGGLPGGLPDIVISIDLVSGICARMARSAEF
jgi:hypothetical protein